MTRGRCRKFGFTQVTREQVLTRIRKSPNKNSFGNDKISYTIMKILNIFIAEELKEIINLSLKLKTYPSAWSVAVLKPLYKGAGKDCNDSSSNRPVSLSSAMSRVMEGLLSSQMNEFAENSGLLHPGVHGYRTGLSTTTALVEIQSRLIKAVEEK